MHPQRDVGDLEARRGASRVDPSRVGRLEQVGREGASGRAAPLSVDPDLDSRRLADEEEARERRTSSTWMVWVALAAIVSVRVSVR